MHRSGDLEWHVLMREWNSIMRAMNGNTTGAASASTVRYRVMTINTVEHACMRDESANITAEQAAMVCDEWATATMLNVRSSDVAEMVTHDDVAVVVATQTHTREWERGIVNGHWMQLGYDSESTCGEVGQACGVTVR